MVNADLTDAILHSVNLANTDMQHAHLSRAILSDANPKLAIMDGVVFTQADLTGADMRDARLAYAEFDDAKLDDFTLLPDGAH